jgi:hypothetical protein
MKLPPLNEVMSRKIKLGSSKFQSYANSLLIGTPVVLAKFTVLQFETAVQVKLGAPVTATANLVGNPITQYADCSSIWVGKCSNNLKKVTGVKNDGARELHDT